MLTAKYAKYECLWGNTDVRWVGFHPPPSSATKEKRFITLTPGRRVNVERRVVDPEVVHVGPAVEMNLETRIMWSVL
jgi:hypothetical protein